jgi:DNA-binding transcriptional LysR family regulator
MLDIPAGYITEPMINLNQLRVFKAIFEEQSITGAARRLRISQPAVSKQLAELESALGAPLVDRLPRGIRLTQAGEVIQSHARRIFRAEEDAEQALAELLGLARGRLSVGASTTIGSYLVPRVFGDFHAAHPGVALELEIDNTSSIQVAVTEGRLDLGLTEGFVAGETLEVSVFAHDEMVLIVSPRHPWAAAGTIPLEELSRSPLLARERGSGSRDVIEAELAKLDVHLQPVMSLGSTEAVKNAVARDLGAAFVSRITVELELRVGVLAEVGVTGVSIRRALHRVMQRGKHPSAATSAFLHLLGRHFPT